MEMKMRRTRLLRLLHLLNKRGPINPYAVAFILTETHFRGPLHRFCELACAVLMLNLSRRQPKLTLGMCQVGLIHWQNAFGMRTWALVRAVLDDASNYQICCDYLRSKKWADLGEAAIHYNGKPSHLYVQLLRSNLMFVVFVTKRMNIDISGDSFSHNAESQTKAGLQIEA
jgi:hypothetical protein